MPVIFKCKCGQYFTAANSLINKEFTCVKCHSQELVPNPFVSEVQEDALDALFTEDTQIKSKDSDIEENIRCQNCGARIISNQVSCNSCGKSLL